MTGGAPKIAYVLGKARRDERSIGIYRVLITKLLGECVGQRP